MQNRSKWYSSLAVTFTQDHSYIYCRYPSPLKGMFSDSCHHGYGRSLADRTTQVIPTNLAPTGEDGLPNFTQGNVIPRKDGFKEG